MSFKDEKWVLEDGRSIKTPDGRFHLTYGRNEDDNSPMFRDFVKLDRIAHLVADLPEIMGVLEDSLRYVDMCRKLTAGEGDIAAMNIRAIIKKAKGE